MSSYAAVKFCALLALGAAATSVSAEYTCTPKSAPASGLVCGTIGYMHDFDYYIQDLVAPDETTVEGCAAACAATPGCLSAVIDPGSFCELLSGTSQQTAFGADSTSYYAMIELGCYDCVSSTSTVSSSSSSSSTSTSASSSSSSSTVSLTTSSSSSITPYPTLTSGSSNTTSDTSTSSHGVTTSTIYAISVFTVTKCPPTVTNCPVGHVTTEIVAISTTVCPVTTSQTPALSVHSFSGSPPSAPMMSLSTASLTTLVPSASFSTTPSVKSSTITVLPTLAPYSTSPSNSTSATSTPLPPIIASSGAMVSVQWAWALVIAGFALL